MAADRLPEIAMHVIKAITADLVAAGSFDLATEWATVMVGFALSRNLSTAQFEARVCMHCQAQPELVR